MALRNRVAVITGSACGIGLGLAHAFAGAGCDLVINGFAPPTETQALVERIEGEHHLRAMHHPEDVAQPVQCLSLIEDALKAFGRVDHPG